MPPLLREPTTPEEWRDVMALAEAGLALDAARQYGLLTGGPQVNVARCVDVLGRGRALGYGPPTLEAVDAAIAALIAPERVR